MMSDALQITNVLIVVVPFFSCLEIKGNGLGNKCAFKYTNRKTTALLGSYCTCVYYFFLQQTLPVLFICNWQEGILFIYRTVFVQLGISQLDEDELMHSGVLRLVVVYLHVGFSTGTRAPRHYRLWDSRTLACRASQVFFASPSNMAVLGL